MKILKKIAVIALGVIMAGSVFALAACDGDTPPDDDNGNTANVLTAPTDFDYDYETGEFTFTATDSNAGYYFVRAFAVTNGVEATTYTTSSSRIAGGKTGELSGSIDTSALGWGEYNIKLMTYKAAGTDYTAPDAVVKALELGVNGVLEKPELMVITDGNTVDVIVDWYTLRDYYQYQCLPMLEIKFCSDEAMTTVVKTDTVNLHDCLSTWDGRHPAGGIMWGHDASNGVYHGVLTADGAPAAFKTGSYSYELGAGNYYVTVQAKSPASFISDSKVSDKIAFSLTDEEMNNDYKTFTSDRWIAPSVLGKPLVLDRVDTSKEHEGASARVDHALNQTGVLNRIKE